MIEDITIPNWLIYLCWAWVGWNIRTIFEDIEKAGKQ